MSGGLRYRCEVGHRYRIERGGGRGIYMKREFTCGGMEEETRGNSKRVRYVKGLALYIKKKRGAGMDPANDTYVS